MRKLANSLALLALLAGLGHAPALLAAACTNVATGNWSAAGTWAAPCNVAGGPVAADTVTIINNTTVTVNNAGMAASSVTINGGANASRLTFAAGSSLAVTNNVVVNLPTAAVTKSITVLTGTLTVGGNVTLNGGTAATRDALLSVSTGLITINGGLIINATVATSSTASITAAGGRITVNGAAGVTNGDRVTVGPGTFSVTNAAATFNNTSGTIVVITAVSTGTLDIAGNLTNAAGETVQLTGAGTITVNGTVTNNGTYTVGTGTANAGTFTNNSVVTVSSGLIDVTGNYTNTAGGDTVTISNVAGRLTVAGTLTNGGTVTAATGTVNAGTFTNNSVVTVSTGLIDVTGVYTNTAVGDTVTITGAGGRLTVGGTLTNAGSIIFNTAAGGIVNANGDFVSSGIVTNTTAGTLNIGGNATVNGTFTAGAGEVVFNGGSAQNASGATLAFFDVTVSNGSGVTLANSLTAGGTLTLTSGVVTTGANTLVVTAALCAAPSVTRTSGWVSGNLQKRIPAGASVCTFEVGGASVYAPITATFIAGAAAANITATTTDGDHASIATSGLDPILTANRSWSLTSTVAQATAFSAVFNFDATDLDTDTQPATLFNARSFSGGAWAIPTTGTLTATSTQVTGLTLAAATQKDFVVGEVAADAGGAGTASFNVVENLASATAGKIYTKLAGTAFTLDLVALDAARGALNTAFKGVVKVQLLNASDNSGVLDANGCRPTWTVIQTLGTNPQFLAADSGRKQNVSFTESNAWPDVRARVSYPATGTATLIGCSTDNFAIRPLDLTSVTSTMTNTGTTGTPKAIAGSGNFTLIAATGLTGYTGTPKIDNTAVQAHASAKQNGSVSGSFPAAVSGTSTGTNVFTYSEVGNFKFLGSAATSGSTTARGVYDDTFTAVDGASDCTADFSNVVASGKYGCKFGITADTSFFGRFYPANFVLTPGTFTNRRIAACAPASTFTYAGEEFRGTFTLTAKNGAGVPVTTQNYDPAAGFASFDANTIANLGFGAVDLADATPPLTATALTASLTLGTSSGTWASGSVPVTADLMLSRAASPNGPFESFKLGIDPVDADGVKLSSYDLDTTVPADTSDHGLVGTSKIRFGRLRLSNALGSELLGLPVPIETQYWNGTAFVTNIADDCTNLTLANITLGNYQRNGADTWTTGVSFTGPFSAGVGNLTLSKPILVITGKGSVDVTVDLAAESKTYLQGAWTGATYTQNPTARAAFGVYKGSNEFIYLREMY